MSRTLERIVLAIGIIILFVSLMFAACLAKPFVALPLSLLTAAGCTVLWMYFELPYRPVWRLPLLLLLSSLPAVAIVEFGFRPSFPEWFCPPGTAAAATLTLFLLLRGRLRCALCDKRLGAGAVTFHCPRCRQQVCDETCWEFTHRRCRLCLEQRVFALPLEEKWWLRVAGPQSKQGRCQICLAAAGQADLRACPHCRRMQCRDCWDFSNGECARCGGALPELPEALLVTEVRFPGKQEISVY